MIGADKDHFFKFINHKVDEDQVKYQMKFVKIDFLLVFSGKTQSQISGNSNN